LIKLIERTSELAAIGAALRRGGLVVVEGGAGLGKTALLDAACDMAAQKRRLILRARGADLERDFALESFANCSSATAPALGDMRERHYSVARLMR
jgi:ribose 1,5-bisphosphokinase PhnN